MKRNVMNEQHEADSIAQKGGHNKPERLSWFRQQGLGAFVHISLDVQFGMVISHNLINANAGYCERYFDQLPKTFDPHAFHAGRWARFFRTIGLRYVVLTNKHHNGFCLWHTATTDFNIKNTPFGRDVTRELMEACRAEGLGVGVYFSPDDFHVLYQQGKVIRRFDDEVLPKNNPELMALAKAQVTELLTQYGTVDMIFFDGDPTELKELAWELQPDCIVTRGAIATPEQRLPDSGEGQDPEAIEAWEACFTMGRQWQYRALHEAYKSPRKIVEMIIRTRSGGGNLLMNFGPRPDGSLSVEQEAIMREVGLWLFVNHEAIYDVRPFRVGREGDVFFTQATENNTVFAHLTNIDWPSLPSWGADPDAPRKREDSIDDDGLHCARLRRVQWRLKSIKAGPQTTVRLMAQRTYPPTPRAVEESIVWEQVADELVITAWYVHRQYNDSYWDLPMVVRIDNPVMPCLDTN